MKSMQKLYYFLSKNKVLIMTLFLSVFSINYLFNMNHVTPYGYKSLLCIDFYHQYGPMMYEYWARLHGDGGFIYSFYQGLGLPFFRNFMNYLSSPFNLLMLLFKKDDLLKSISLIIGLKSVASSCTMAYYLKTKFKQNHLVFVPIALLYGFSAYYRSYYWNLMWIDGMIWLPIVILGIENIVNNKKWKLYTISLAILLLSNYFVGYMICVFSCFYFLFYYIYKANLKGKKFKDKIKDVLSHLGIFAGSSLLGGGISAFLLLPMANALLSTSATGSMTLPTSQYYSFEMIDFLSAHLSCVGNVTFASDEVNSPNISAGIFSVFIFIAYLFNIKLSKKNKFCYIGLYSIVLMMIFIPQFDFIMHAFHVPNDLPYRYSFLYTFVFLIMGAYAGINLTKESYPKLLFLFLFTLGIIVVSIFEPWVNTTVNMLYINIILLVLYFIFIVLAKLFTDYKSIFLAALSLVATIDIIESTNYAWGISQVEENFVQATIETDGGVKYIKKIDDSLFYRIDTLSYHTLNDSSKSYYNGMTTFSSMAYESLAKLQINLGMPGNNINSYQYIQQTPIYDLMFDIKYVFGRTNDNIRYEQIDNNTSKNIYRFNNTVGLAFGVNKDVLEWNYSNNNPFENQLDFVEKATGINNVLEKRDNTKHEIIPEDSIKVYKYLYLNNGDNFYINWNDSAISFIIIGDTLYKKDDKYSNLNTLSYSSIEDYENSEIINAKTEDEYLSIIVGYNYLDETSLNVYSINNDSFNDLYSKFKHNSLLMTYYNESIIKGNIKIDEDQIVYTSIPYDKGWSVYVDGKKTDTFSIGNSLLGFNAKEGQHTIEFKYSIPYIGIGSIISVVSIGTFILISLNKDKKLTKKLFKKKRLKK